MYKSIVEIPTQHASKYMKQLCKHFAHKVEVRFDDTKAHVDFPMGISDMAATDHLLTIQAQTDISEAALKTIQSIIEQHLVKFAWREEISFDWQSAA